MKVKSKKSKFPFKISEEFMSGIVKIIKDFHHTSLDILLKSFGSVTIEDAAKAWNMSKAQAKKTLDNMVLEGTLQLKDKKYIAAKFKKRNIKLK